jgi:hypothetical protein
VENFQADLDALKIRRAAFEEQVKKADGDARSLREQLREIDAQIAVLEEAIGKGNVERSLG